MFNDYEDIIRDFSEAEAVIEELKIRMDKIITEEAKRIMEAYRTAILDIGNVEKEISRKMHQVRNLQQKIEELETQYEETDKFEMPRRYANKFVAEYTKGFVPGDTVYMIKNQWQSEICDKCHGEKTIPAIIDGVEQSITCVKCGGKGKLEHKVKTVKKTEINNIHLTLCFHENRVGIWTNNVIYVKGEDYAINAGDLYSTQEEAEAHIKGVEK